ncbi:hypothetical protein A3K62_02260 [Candidatus Pacearchaeota archaeon RBG_16_35_8]|nr:MAG: hypothetical protein A3K62_02260 [Candidatus Pacearchaeota archaeon RBG_16_35_8]
MKRVILVHGWGFNPTMNWYPWLKKELEKKGFEVIIPAMPNTNEPDINSWVFKLREFVGRDDGELILIGHSIGCQTIMRFLEKEDYKSKVGKVIFVAGWFKLSNLEDKAVEKIAKPWMNNRIDFNKVKQKISKIIIFLSSNEPYGHVNENKKIFEEKLEAKVIILKNKGHFTEDDGVRKLPEILEFLE